jgi:hypothetical protein
MRFARFAMVVTVAAGTGCFHDPIAPTPPVLTDVGPPPPDKDERPADRPGFVWVAGRWARSGEKWVWLDGYYDRARPGYRWEQGRWVHVATPVDEPKEPVKEWASDVRAFSSQYSTDGWSASQALGPPDVYPQTGDMPKAWATQLPDAPGEFIEVGFKTPMRISALEIYETFNPGAIQRIDLITPTRTLSLAATGSSDQPYTILMTCTSEPVLAVRVTLDSAAVPGWNEIDAIGLTACP